MLVELRAENYAVIDHAIAVFGPGLNLLTGETGAGKSILVDALALLMGGKASTEIVRHGADKAVVACVFESTPAAEAVLEENGIDAEGNEIILRREILSTGKGRVFVNNQPATVAVLRQLAPELALVHAQSETLSSFDQTQQRILLDRFGGDLDRRVAAAYEAWRAAQAKLDDLLTNEQDRLRMVDLWSYQAKEIESAQSVAGEDEALETEKRVLANAEKLYAAAMSAFDQLYEGGAFGRSGVARCAASNLDELARYDDKFNEAAQQIESARATVGDVSATLRDYAEAHQCFSGAAGRDRRSAGAARSAEAEVRQDGRRCDRAWRGRCAQAGRSRRSRRDAEDAARRTGEGGRQLTSRLRRALSAQRKTAARKAGQACRDADQFAGDEGAI